MSNIMLDKMYPDSGLYKSINKERKNEVLTKLAGYLKDEAKKEYKESTGKDLDKMSSIQISGIKIGKPVDQYKFVSWTAVNKGNSDLKYVVYNLDFYKNGKKVANKKYDWNLPMKVNEYHSEMSDTPDKSNVDYDDVEITVADCD